MRRLVYDVAATLDGRISDAQGGVAGFVQEGDHVEAYQARLAGYDTVIMGRRTYEFGYAWGMKPGDRAYPHMEHFVFSKRLELPHGSPVTVVATDALAFVRELKAREGGDIYLSGGGAFAGAMLAGGVVDRLIVKLNPLLAGGGVELFAGAPGISLRLLDVERYTSGVVLLTYDIEASAGPKAS